MSSFRNASKSYQKVHRERSQLQSRENLGQLEKKKDYKKRASEHHKRENALKLLRKKASDKNPDEFYFHMVNSKMIDGEHHSQDKSSGFTEEQILLMQSQDIRYIKFRRDIESKKIHKLKSELQLLDNKSIQNKHYIFLESKQEVTDFDLASYFNTDEELVNRPYNRIKTSTLEQINMHNIDDKQLAIKVMERQKMYDQLKKRIEREKQLRLLEDKMTLNKLLLDTKSKKKKITDESKDKAAIYKWMFQRKR